MGFLPVQRSKFLCIIKSLPLQKFFLRPCKGQNFIELYEQ
jgi:hypothetical protein